MEAVTAILVVLSASSTALALVATCLLRRVRHLEGEVAGLRDDVASTRAEAKSARDAMMALWKAVGPLRNRKP